MPNWFVIFRLPNALVKPGRPGLAGEAGKPRFTGEAGNPGVEGKDGPGGKAVEEPLFCASAEQAINIAENKTFIFIPDLFAEASKANVVAV